jgi:NitT/TauT family transport system ATP-binding protein
LPRKEIEARARELFAQLRLTGAIDKYPRQLSGGMRQRVSLIRTLVHDPPLLLMDEPFGALDALTRLQVRTDLEALWLRRRPTVLFITHSVEEAVGLSDRILVMGPSPGEVVDEIRIDLPRPRPIVLGDVPQFSAYVDRIHKQFERLGVLQGIDTTAGTSP